MANQPGQTEFNECLANFLREKNAQGKSRASIVSRELHDLAGATENRMPLASIAMFRLALHQGGKAKLLSHPLPNGAGSKIEIEFDTADLPPPSAP